ncbi:head GIN domain-containing protein [Pedomonas sp. V897]|uniref:head GIN domain-containing protein n=1 Tax=Pedomonas sp. V897 TaxID=3446482 RepID=UPI003EE0F826
MRVPTFARVCLAILSGAVTLAGAALTDARAAPVQAATLERQIDVRPFTGIALEGAMDIRVVQADRIQVLARGSQAALETLDVRVEDGVLRLKQKNSIRLPGDDRLAVTISLPDLRAFLLAGSGNVALDGVSADELTLKVAGSGTITASGTCRKLSVNIAGSGDVKAEALQCDTVTVRIAGSGDVATYARETFAARIMGSGDITVFGNPKDRTRSVLGSGSVIYQDTAVSGGRR